jgi:predicted GNAT family acetyltransferase
MVHDETELINNESIHNFEWFVEGQRAFIDYSRGGNTVSLLHTEVPKALEGKGIAAALVEKTFRYMERKHLTLVPLCPYVKHYLEKKPEWIRLIAE